MLVDSENAKNISVFVVSQYSFFAKLILLLNDSNSVTGASPTSYNAMYEKNIIIYHQEHIVEK